MSTVASLFSHTLGRKVIMALTGLFLILFLTGHLLGNTLLFVNDNGQSFNEYARFMTTNPIIKVLSILTYFSIIVHTIYSIVLTIQNRKARPQKYVVDKRGENSIWASRNMGVLGTAILVFLIIHLRSFWYKMRFGNLEFIEEQGVYDLYFVVQEAFSQGWYVALYILSMIALGFHLYHAFQSAFQTLGINHKAYSLVIKNVGKAYAIIVPALFALIPVYMYLGTKGIW